MSKHNYFVRFLKKFNLSTNSLLEKYLNKLNFNNFLIIARSNKVFLTFVALIILFLSYLSIPHAFNKVEIQKELENQLFEKFTLNFKFSNKFDYSFYPRPHFVVKNSNIFKDELEISDIKKIRIFVSLSNLFSLKNIVVKDVILENTNFNLNKKNSNFFINLLDNDFLDTSFTIKNSNVFFQNIEKEVLFINKIIKMKYYYDPKELKNIINSKNEVFNIPYQIISFRNEKEKKLLSKININFFKLQLENEIDYSGNIKKGFTNLIFDKDKSQVSYEIDKNSFVFNFFSKSNDPKFSYQGMINFNPFYANLKGETKELDLIGMLNSNSLFVQMMKTEILNNKNLNFDLNIKANKIYNYRNFENLILKSNIKEGLIDIENTNLNWKNYVNFSISDSLIYINDNQLILDGKLIINLIQPNEIYKFLLTPKNYRADIKKVEFNFNYSFDQKIMILNDIKINGKKNQNVSNILKKLLFKEVEIQNKIYFKNLMNKALKSYVG